MSLPIPRNEQYHPDLEKFIGWYPSLMIFPASLWYDHKSSLDGEVFNGMMTENRIAFLPDSQPLKTDSILGWVNKALESKLFSTPVSIDESKFEKSSVEKELFFTPELELLLSQTEIPITISKSRDAAAFQIDQVSDKTKPVFVFVADCGCEDFMKNYWMDLNRYVFLRENKVSVAVIAVLNSTIKIELDNIHPGINNFMDKCPLFMIFPGSLWHDHKSNLEGRIFGCFKMVNHRLYYPEKVEGTSESISTWVNDILTSDDLFCENKTINDPSISPELLKLLQSENMFEKSSSKFEN
jgi:hypothetical protein